MGDGWVDACGTGDIDEEDVIGFRHEGQRYALYRTADDRYLATDGLCTHEQAPLHNGLVMDEIIECPRHNGRFDFAAGEAKGAPVCENLKIYETRISDGRLLVKIG